MGGDQVLSKIGTDSMPSKKDRRIEIKIKHEMGLVIEAIKAGKSDTVKKYLKQIYFSAESITRKIRKLDFLIEAP